jgi:lysine 2,3-aminomutase
MQIQMPDSSLAPVLRFISHAPGYWKSVSSSDWDDWRWQQRNRITTLAALEEHLTLSSEERAGVLLAGTKLALAVTPHYFNLIEPENPSCPIRRQVIPRIEEGYDSPYDMADPCGEDSHMPVPGLVHRYPDRVLFLVTDRCASYCRYCTRSRVVSGVGEQELVTDFEEAFRYLEKTRESAMCSCPAGMRSCSPTRVWSRYCSVCARFLILNFCASAPVFPFFFRNASRRNSAPCFGNSIRFG